MTDSNTTPVPSGDSASGGQNPASQQPVPLQPTQPAPYSSQGTQPYGGQQAYAGQAGYGAQQSYGYGAQQTSGSAQHSAAQPYGQQTYEAEPVSMHAQHAAPKGNGGKTFLIAFAGALVACVLAFGVWGITSAMIPGSSGSGTSTVVTDPSTGETTVIAPSEDPTLAEAVSAKCLPSVAAITVYAEASQNDAMSQYFGYQYGGQGDGSGDLVAYSQGSGVVLTEDGYIITNNHVVDGAQSVSVQLSDGTSLDAKIIGTDEQTDLAVIKIEGSDFPAAVMGNSDEVVLGESVVAIGNPAGLSGSVTNGIVSGLNRQIRSDATGFDMNCIQTNAAISPGNSGGALVNMYGQVIGITSSKYVSSSYEGLGFAITINEVLPIVQDLIDNGYVADRVRVGITFISLIPEEVRQGFADEIGMKTVPDNLSGVWITEIADDCDIASTDLQVNDVIVSVQGEAVDDYDSLNAAIAGLKGGDTIEARCRRYQPDGNFEEFSIQCKLMADTSGNY